MHRLLPASLIALSALLVFGQAVDADESNVIGDVVDTVTTVVAPVTAATAPATPPAATAATSAASAPPEPQTPQEGSFLGVVSETTAAVVTPVSEALQPITSTSSDAQPEPVSTSTADAPASAVTSSETTTTSPIEPAPITPTATVEPALSLEPVLAPVTELVNGTVSAVAGQGPPATSSEPTPASQPQPEPAGGIIGEVEGISGGITNALLPTTTTSGAVAPVTNLVGGLIAPVAGTEFTPAESVATTDRPDQAVQVSGLVGGVTDVVGGLIGDPIPAGNTGSTLAPVTDLVGGLPGEPVNTEVAPAPAASLVSPVTSILAPVIGPILGETASGGAAVHVAASQPVGGLLQPVTTMVDPLVAPAAPVLTPVIASVSPVTTPVLRTAAPILAAVVAVVSPVIEPVVAVVSPVTAPVVVAVAPIFEPVSEVVNPIVTPVMTSLVEAVSPVVQPVVGAIEPVLEPVLGTPLPIVDGLDPIVDVVAPIVYPIIDAQALVDVLDPPMTGVKPPAIDFPGIQLPTLPIIERPVPPVVAHPILPGIEGPGSQPIDPTPLTPPVLDGDVIAPVGEPSPNDASGLIPAIAETIAPAPMLDTTQVAPARVEAPDDHWLTALSDLLAGQATISANGGDTTEARITAVEGPLTRVSAADGTFAPLAAGDLSQPFGPLQPGDAGNGPTAGGGSSGGSGFASSAAAVLASAASLDLVSWRAQTHDTLKIPQGIVLSITAPPG